MKNKKVKFSSTGNVLGNLWGSGQGGYHAVKIQADSETDLLKLAKEKLKDGSLDAGAGFENLIGAILVIEKRTTIEIDGDEFINRKYETKYIGKLTKKEKEWLEKDYYDSRQ